MEKADQYAFFSPNYFAAKKTQIKLEKLLNTDIKEYDHNIFTPNKIYYGNNNTNKIN